MPIIAKELTALQVKRLTRPGWHAVGGVAGLLLQIRAPTSVKGTFSRSWVLRLRTAGKRQPLGLGPYPQVTLAEAREQARQLVQEARKGVDLIAKKRALRSALLAAAAKNKTFAECAAAYLKAHATDYSNEKHRKQWSSTLETYAYPILGKLLVSDIGMRHVLDVLQQSSMDRKKRVGTLWAVKTETAKRLLDRIRAVLDYATVKEYRSGMNPATWKGYLDTQLAAPGGLKKVRHQPALPYNHIGTFMTHLRKNTSVSARAIEFLILTGVRSGSVRLATWSEIDLDQRLWVIPAAHTKRRVEHRVPLQPQAIKLLQALPRIAGTDIIFPNTRGKSLSDMALSQLMRGMRERGELTSEAVPHGFRSTFRDWAAEQTNYPDEIRKAASGHAVGDAVKTAYQRTDLLEKRRRLMNDWADYIDQPLTSWIQAPAQLPRG
jgi:integrase